MQKAETNGKLQVSIVPKSRHQTRVRLGRGFRERATRRKTQSGSATVFGMTLKQTRDGRSVAVKYRATPAVLSLENDDDRSLDPTQPPRNRTEHSKTPKKFWL